MEYLDVEVLKGKTLKEIKVSEDKSEIYFTDSEDTQYKMYHDQNCCESVYLEDVVGDLSDLLGSPILTAREDTNRESNPEDLPDYTNYDSFTWTFYNFATIKGSVTMRWYGESNGYYSESVDFVKL